MPPTEPAQKRSCLKGVLWISLLILLVLLLLFFVISTLFELNVWDEFWDLIAQKTGWSPK